MLQSNYGYELMSVTLMLMYIWWYKQ